MAMATVTMTMVVNTATVLLMEEECAVGSGREGVEGGCGGREVIDMPLLSYRPHSPIQKSVHTQTSTEYWQVKCVQWCIECNYFMVRM